MQIYIHISLSYMRISQCLWSAEQSRESRSVLARDTSNCFVSLKPLPLHDKIHRKPNDLLTRETNDANRCFGTLWRLGSSINIFYFPFISLCIVEYLRDRSIE